MKYTIVAQYLGGINREYDLALFTQAKYVMGGSGMGGGSCDLRSGQRINDWYLQNKEDAELLKTLLLQVKIPGLEVKII